MSPSSGPAAGGTPLTFTGTNFAGSVSVTFPDGSSATNITIVNPTTITATAPAQSATDIGGGNVTLSLTSGGITTSFTKPYAYVPAPAPTLTSISPSSGTTAGGTLVTLTGSNFANITAVTFGVTAATGFTLVNSTTVTATTPAQAAGPVTVTVASTVGSVISYVTTTYTYVTPVTTSTNLTSSANPAAAGTPVTFTATITSGSGTPTGSVTFKDGATNLGTATLAGGIATLSTSALTVGTHSITAVYAGNLPFAASTSAPLAQAINTPADSLKLRALQIAATKVVAQNSGQAISNAIDSAISEGFSDSQQPVSASGSGLRFNFTADSPVADRGAAAATRNRDDDAFSSLAAPQARSFAAETKTPNSRVDDAFSALGYAGNVTKAPPAAHTEPREWLAWADVQVSGIEHWGAASTATLYGNQVNALLGLTRKLTPDFLVGVLGGYETFDYRSDALAGRLKGDGWTVGSYAGWRFLPGLRFDAAVAYSGIGYDGVAGTAAGTFNGNRWLISGGLIGTYKVGGLEIEPSAKIFGLWERENAYTDSLGTLQADRTFTSGRGSGGVKFTHAFVGASGTVVAPYVGVYGDYYFTGDNAAVTALAGAVPLAAEALFEGWSARATGGIAAKLQNGATVTFGSEFGGIGGNVQIWTFRGRASVPF
jgi:hypothetical protein